MFARNLPLLISRSLKRGKLPFTKFIMDATRRQQFGNRFLTNPDKVFEHNAWDNVEWDEAQEAEAREKVTQNSAQMVEPDKQELYEKDASRFWDEFYSIHQNRFFKDRHWLFTEFPELLGKQKLEKPDTENQAASSITEQEGANSSVQSETGSTEENIVQCVSSKIQSDNDTDSTQSPLSEELKSDSCVSQIDDTVHTKHLLLDLDKASDKAHGVQCSSSDLSVAFPGKGTEFRIFEVGCGVGNTVYPVLQTNNDQKLFVYCCDLSETAIQLVKEHADYAGGRCHAFVCDVTSDSFPFPEASLDVITLIFVLSAVHPDKMQGTVSRLARCLKPGGVILFRDYGRYDMAQLRFKNGRCLSDNFYVRGDGTRVYFFTQEELRDMFTNAGLVETQNLVDRRLQVNRGRQLKMYRVWIQCKYTKP